MRLFLLAGALDGRITSGLPAGVDDRLVTPRRHLPWVVLAVIALTILFVLW